MLDLRGNGTMAGIATSGSSSGVLPSGGADGTPGYGFTSPPDQALAAKWLTLLRAPGPEDRPAMPAEPGSARDQAPASAPPSVGATPGTSGTATPNPYARRPGEDTDTWGMRLTDAKNAALVRLKVDREGAKADLRLMNRAIAADPEFQQSFYADLQGLSRDAFQHPERYGTPVPDRQIGLDPYSQASVEDRLRFFTGTNVNLALRMGADGVVYDISRNFRQADAPPSPFSSMFSDNAEITDNLGEQIREHGFKAVPPELLAMAIIGLPGMRSPFGRGVGRTPANPTEGIGRSPALRGDPYHPESVEARIRPPYETNEAHSTFSSRYNPNKDPEPVDAQEVYRRSMTGEMGIWYGRSSDGRWYQFHYDNVSRAHFAGVVTEAEVPRWIVRSQQRANP